MKITTYICDRCKRKSEEAQELALSVVAIGIRRDNSGVYAGNTFSLTDHLYRQKEMCIDCCKELGIWQPIKLKEDGKPDSTKYPTLEDLIREMIQDEIANNEYSK